MKQIDFYFDFISPYAYLAFAHLPEALMGHGYQVNYKPLLFAGLLKHHGQLGPAEIGPKRAWTYRQILWLARQHGIDLQLPANHPFNPLPLLRLALACGAAGDPNRYVTETIFRHVWCTGLDPVAPDRIQALAQQLAPVRDMHDAVVKDQLRQNTEAAVALGLFGVPTMVVDGMPFWGMDALPMVREYLGGDAGLSAADVDAVARVAVGVRRHP